MNVCPDVRGPQRLNLADFGDALTVSFCTAMHEVQICGFGKIS